MRDYRAKQKLLIDSTKDGNCKVNSKTNSKTNALDKNRIDKNREEINYNKLIEIYNFNCPNLPQVKKLTEKRKKTIKGFLKEFTQEQFEEICKIANSNSFLKGNNDRGWKADFDFLMRVDKATSILEGKYENNNIKSNNNVFEELREEMKNED